MKEHIYIKTLRVVLVTIVLLTSSAVFPEENEETGTQSLKGQLLLPDDYNNAKDKKCMTVCDQWGKNCIVNPKTGSRKCRRVCKSYARGCF